MFLTKKSSAEEAVNALDAVVAVAALPCKLPIKPAEAFNDPVIECLLSALRINFALSSPKSVPVVIIMSPLVALVI